MKAYETDHEHGQDARRREPFYEQRNGRSESDIMMKKSRIDSKEPLTGKKAPTRGKFRGEDHISNWYIRRISLRGDNTEHNVRCNYEMVRTVYSDLIPCQMNVLCTS